MSTFTLKKMPIIYCVALGCRNTNCDKQKTEAQTELEKTVRVTFHAFPVDPIRRAEWLKIMKLEITIFHKRRFIYLCSLHFEEKFIDRSSLFGDVRLRENAIPHLYENTLCDNTFNLTMEMDAVLESDAGQHLPGSRCDKETNTSSSTLSQKVRGPMVDKETRVSPERIWNCPAAQTIKRVNHVTITNLKKEIKVLERKIKEKDKRILIMKNILDELKVDYLSDEDQID